MPLSPSLRPPHVSRKVEIPANLILNWQSSALRGGGAKPLVRRPKTACERCRTAKVKCYGDGQHGCDRCTSRGLACRYPQQASSPSSSTSTSSSRRVQEDLPMHHLSGSVEPSDQFGDDAFQQLLDSSVGWPDMNDQTSESADPAGQPQSQSQAQAQAQPQQMDMDWGAVDPMLDLLGGSGLPSTSATPSTGLTAATSHSNTNTTISTPASSEEPQRSLSSLGLFPLITSASAGDLSWQTQLGGQSCQCRAGLAQLIPDARAALQERRLDAVCRVTGNVIQRCQDIVGCQDCHVNCTDLICIMAIFQEADPCFEYMAKGAIDRPISVSLGSYETAVVDERDAQSWRQMLVMQLVRRANDLLHAISARGQAMLQDLDPRCRLGRVNIDYLEAVIGNSRDNFNHIMKGFRDESRRLV